MPTAGGERPSDGRLRSVASGSAAKPANDSLQRSTQSHFAAILRKRADQSSSLADRLRQLGIDTVAVESADALFRLLEERRTDLYVVDNQLDGLFSGQEIIGKLRKQWSQIPAVLINRGDESLADVARAMGGVTILDSAANVDEIAETVLRIVKHQGDDQELIPERARALVDNQGDLPVMPQLVLRLMTYLGMPGEAIPLLEMCRAISVDPKASLVVLKAANASINGLSRNIVNVPDAIRLLGVQRAVGHILMAAMTDGMGDLSKGLTTEQQTWHGRRGMLIASTSSHFAEQLEHRSGETALLLGILQDIGMPILLRANPKEYGAVLHRWHEIGHLKLASIEQSELGCTHADVSAALLKRWNMPSALVRPVLHHLRPTADAAKAGVDTGLHRVMMIAEALADSIDAPHHANRRSALDRMLASYGLPQKKAACLSLQNAVAKAAEAFQLMSVPLPSAQELESMVRSALSESLPNIKEATGSSAGSQAALRAGTSKR
jgi:HD-like signal output (HDOD) protein